MAYIGQGIKQGTFKVLDTSGNTYNGSNVTFSLGTQVGSAAQLLVSHDGVIQKAGTDYTLATGGTQITFSTAPASGASIFITEISGAVGGTVTPSDTSVTADKLNTALLTGQTDIGADIADADLFLIDDGAGGTLRKTAASRIKTYVGGFDVSSITGATALTERPATTDEFVFSDAGTLKRVDFTHMVNWELLSTTTASSSSVVEIDYDFSNDYHYYKIFMDNVDLSANDDHLGIQGKVSSGYITASTGYGSARYGRRTNGDGASSDLATGDYVFSQISLNNGAPYFDNDENVQGVIEIWNPKDSHYKCFSFKLIYGLQDDVGQIEGIGHMKQNGDLEGVRFVTEGSATITGTFRLYGFK
jgi:hypothetical protein